MPKKLGPKCDSRMIKLRIKNRCVYGTLGTVYKDQPYVTPVTYIYNPKSHSIFFHGAKTGRLRANLHFNNLVSFCLVEVGEIFSHREASEFNIEYNSVTIFGQAYLLKNRESIRSALQALLNKYAPHMSAGKDYQEIQEKEIVQTNVYQIKIQDWSGKRQQYDPKFYSGAFPYSQITKFKR
jgi:nitroimidazol reductase NimA-like FMN-containing flavoprotein (pyridoxamine 5'-phosphate oxidase superfamily)